MVRKHPVTGFLIGQGYRVPVTPISIVIGITSVINASLGGHPSIVARTGVAILAGPDAGPKELGQPYGCNPHVDHLLGRWAGHTHPRRSARVLHLRPVGAGYLCLPPKLIPEAFRGNLVFGAVVAFAVASTPFSYMGITSALWAVLAGWRASFIAEREQLLALWREGASQANQS